MTKSLFLELLKAETEDGITKIIKDNGMDNNLEDWKFYGNQPSNHSVIGNQSSSAERALIEKITNAIDALLMRKCYEKGFNPKDTSNSELPTSPKEALEKFYGVKDGLSENIEGDSLEEISNDLILFATSQDQKTYAQLKKPHINLSLFDGGEGQSPNRTPETILSLLSGNKKGIPFTQGNYNQGGSGCLNYCGEKGYCLVISKRHPSIDEKFNQDGDDSTNMWGWTLIRMELRDNANDPVYTYYAPDGTIPRFESKTLPLRPNLLKGSDAKKYLDYDSSCSAGVPYSKETSYGTLIKMYDYNLKQKGPLISHFKYEMSQYILDTYLPVKVIDCRKNKYNNDFIFRGLNKLIEDDKREKEEKRLVNKNFPISTSFTIDKQKVVLTAYGLNHRKGGSKNAGSFVGEGNAIRFTLGQQFQGSLPKSYISNSGLGILKDSLLILLEFPNTDPIFKKDLFMTDRERIADKKPKKEIIKHLKAFLTQDDRIKQFASDRMKELLTEESENDPKVKDALESWLENNPEIQSALGFGDWIPKKKSGTGNKPGGSSHSGDKTDPEPFTDFKDIPTYFDLNHPVDENGNSVIHVTKGKDFKVVFKTDAKLDFLDTFASTSVLKNANTTQSYSHNQTPGKAFFIFNRSLTNREGEFELTFDISCNLPNATLFPLTRSIKVVVEEKKEKDNGKDKSKGFDGLPPHSEVTKENWGDYPEMNESVGASLLIQGDKVHYGINMDNIHLRKKVDNLANEGEIEFYKKLFKYSMLFTAIATKNSEDEKRKNNPDTDKTIEEVVTSSTEVVARTFFVMEQLSLNLRKNLN